MEIQTPKKEQEKNQEDPQDFLIFNSSGKMSNEDSLKNNSNKSKNVNKKKTYHFQELGYNSIPEWQKYSFDRYLVCPYNTNHKVSESYLIYHQASKCKDAKKKDHLFQRCYFNTFHRVPNENYKEHLYICPDKPKDCNIENIFHCKVDSWDNEYSIEDLQKIDLDNIWMPEEQKEKIRKLLEESKKDPSFISQQQIEDEKNLRWNSQVNQQNQEYQITYNNNSDQQNNQDIDSLGQQLQDLKVDEKDFITSH